MKKSFFLIIVFLCLIFPNEGNAQDYTEDIDIQINNLCKQIVDNTNSEAKLMVAITEFQSQGKISDDFSKIITDEITAKLFRTKKFEMFDRSQLSKVASEQKLILQNLNNDEDIKNIGRITGANAILTGSITEFETSIIIHSKLIGVANSNVISIATVTISKNQKKIIPNLELQSLISEKVYNLPASSKGLDIVTNAVNRRISNNLMFEILRIERAKGILVCEVKISNINNSKKFELFNPYITNTSDLSFFGSIEQSNENNNEVKNRISLDILDGESEIIYIKFKTSLIINYFDNINFNIMTESNQISKIIIKIK